MNQTLKDKLWARLCSGAMASFRRTPLRLTPDDLRHLKVSFSQFGEDLLIADHLTNRGNQPRGIYIDAGCFDPFRYSNTRLLSLLGWKGINIDAAPDVIKKFQIHRPHDWNICAALSDKEAEMVLTGSEGSASRRLAKTSQSGSNIKVKTTTLSTALVNSPFHDCPVDLLDIDCEGHDFEVLKGFPFHSVRPLLICIEAHSQIEIDRLHKVLGELDYSKLATRGLTHLYRDATTINENISACVLMQEL